MTLKQRLGEFLLSSAFQQSMWAGGFRKLVRMTGGDRRYSPRFMLDSLATDRPHYAYCLLGAADLARRLGLTRISAIEFGVAGGNGLAFMCAFAERVQRATGVAIDCYGFDTGVGMPEPTGVRDLPYWFAAAQYRMDEAALRARVPDARLVIGDVRDTIAGFVADQRPAPIGAIMNDVDYFSSTVDSLRLFDAAEAYPDSFLPRTFLYFDDIIGGAWEMYGPHNGQLAAIAAFNARHPAKTIHLNQNLVGQTHLPYRHQIYYAHLCDHPAYATYIGGEDQDRLQALLRLRRTD